MVVVAIVATVVLVVVATAVPETRSANVTTNKYLVEVRIIEVVGFWKRRSSSSSKRRCSNLAVTLEGIVLKETAAVPEVLAIIVLVEVIVEEILLGEMAALLARMSSY